MYYDIKKEEAEEMLSPYYETLQECIVGGWEDYNAIYADSRHVHETRTKACITRDHIVDRIKRAFSGVDGIKMYDFTDGLFLLNIQDRICIKFKKLDRKLHPSGIPTQQLLKYNSQENLLLPDFPPDPINVNAGYVTDDSWSGIEGVYIVYLKNNETEWAIDLTTLNNSVKTIDPKTNLGQTDDNKHKNVRARATPLKEKEEGEYAKNGK